MGAFFSLLLVSHSNSLKPLQLHHWKPQHSLLHPIPNPSCSLSLLLGLVSGPQCLPLAWTSGSAVSTYFPPTHLCPQSFHRLSALHHPNLRISRLPDCGEGF